MSNTEGGRFSVCSNHLQSLYEALARDDIKQVVKIEHELTKPEECVACAYVFKSSGEAKNVLARFLIERGFAVSVENPVSKTKGSDFLFWTKRAMLFGCIFGPVFFAENFIRKLLIRDVTFDGVAVFLEIVAVSIVSIVMFLMLDDMIDK